MIGRPDSKECWDWLACESPHFDLLPRLIEETGKVAKEFMYGYCILSESCIQNAGSNRVIPSILSKSLSHHLQVYLVGLPGDPLLRIVLQHALSSPGGLRRVEFWVIKQSTYTSR